MTAQAELVVAPDPRYVDEATRQRLEQTERVEAGRKMYESQRPPEPQGEPRVIKSWAEKRAEEEKRENSQENKNKKRMEELQKMYDHIKGQR